MLLEALRSALTAHGHIVEAVTADPAEAVRLVTLLKPDMCILDVSFPEGDGISAARQIRELAPSTEVMLLSAALSPDVVIDAAAVGVRGFARKGDSLTQVLAAIDRVAAGEVTIDGEVLRAALHQQRHELRSDGPDPLSQLTAREREVLDRIIAGENTATLAARLHISQSTARSHVQNLLIKLGVHTRIQAVVFATSKGAGHLRHTD
jgi:two-component system nitrate/nitrite response regulator NarL